MDIHAPHQSLRTWKDFWIHLGTITAGLLIALGLHHRYQRHALEDALHEESAKNITIIDLNLKIVDRYIIWLDGLQRDLVAWRTSQEKRGFVYPEGSDSELGGLTQYSGLRSSVWQTAQAKGLVELLSWETAQTYTRLYTQVDRVRPLAQQLFDTTEARVAYQRTFASVEKPSSPQIATMTREELIAYTLLIAKNLAAARDLRFRYLFATGATTSILHGASSDEEVVAAEKAEIESHPDPTAARSDKTPAQSN
jgi:hypothetical protein